MDNFNLNNNLYNRIRNLFISLSLNKNFIGKIDTKTKREFIQNYFDKVKKFCEDKFRVDLSKYKLLPFDEYDKYDNYFKEKLGHPLSRVAGSFPLTDDLYEPSGKYPIELKGKIVLNPHFDYNSGRVNIPTVICHELGHSVYAELYGSSYAPHNPKFQNIIEIIYKGMMAPKELGNYHGSFYGSKTIKLTKEIVEDYISYIDDECITSKGNICLVPTSRLKLLSGYDLNRAIITNYLISELELTKNLFNCSYAKSPIDLRYLIRTKDKFINGLRKLVGKEIPVLSLNG